MSDYSLFEELAPAARAVTEAMAQRATEVVGVRCAIEVARHLEPEEVERLLEMQREAFGGEGVAFDRRGLAEVLADPEAVYVLVRAEGRVVAACFGYWEWLDQVTVRGTDFFLDTGMVDPGFRGRGIGGIVLPGVLLLAQLLECQRVGIAAWRGGPDPEALAAFYRRVGFVDVEGGAGAHRPMMAELSAANLARWRRMIGLAA